MRLLIDSVRFLFFTGFSSSSLLSPSLLDYFALRLPPTIFLGAGFSSSLEEEPPSSEEEDSSSEELSTFLAFFLPFSTAAFPFFFAMCYLKSFSTALLPLRKQASMAWRPPALTMGSAVWSMVSEKNFLKWSRSAAPK